MELMVKICAGSFLSHGVVLEAARAFRTRSHLRNFSAGLFVGRHRLDPVKIRKGNINLGRGRLKSTSPLNSLQTAARPAASADRPMDGTRAP